MNILDIEDLPTKSYSAYSIYKRIFILCGLVAAIVISINIWLLGNEHAQNWHDKQANQLGRSLVKQAAGMLVLPLSGQDYKQVELVLAIALADNYVQEAVVFNSSGQPLAELPMPDSILQVHTSDTSHPLVFVEEIVYGQNVLGYLRLQLRPSQVMQYHDEYQNLLFQQSQAVIMLAFLVGAICTRAFYKWRIRRFLNKQSASEKH